MSFINSIIKVFVGDKSQKDVKALQPYLNKIKTFETSLMSLSHDELRARTAYFKEQIKEARAEKDAKIASLKAEVENIEDIDKREDLYEATDALEKEAYELSEKTLLEILPEAFFLLLKKQHVVLKTILLLKLLQLQKIVNFQLLKRISLLKVKKLLGLTNGMPLVKKLPGT